MKSTSKERVRPKNQYPCLMKTKDGTIVFAMLYSVANNNWEGIILHPEGIEYKLGAYSSSFRDLEPFYGTVTLSSED